MHGQAQGAGVADGGVGGGDMEKAATRATRTATTSTPLGPPTPDPQTPDMTPTPRRRPPNWAPRLPPAPSRRSLVAELSTGSTSMSSIEWASDAAVAVGATVGWPNRASCVIAMSASSSVPRLCVTPEAGRSGCLGGVGNSGPGSACNISKVRRPHHAGSMAGVGKAVERGGAFCIVRCSADDEQAAGRDGEGDGAFALSPPSKVYGHIVALLAAQRA